MVEESAAGVGSIIYDKTQRYSDWLCAVFVRGLFGLVGR